MLDSRVPFLIVASWGSCTVPVKLQAEVTLTLAVAEVWASSAEVVVEARMVPETKVAKTKQLERERERERERAIFTGC